MLQEAALVVVANLLLVAASPVRLDATQKLQWESWKSTHGKTYTHENEELERSLIWLNNKKFIDTHNAGGESSFTLAMNKFGDMTDAEWSQTYLGSQPELNNTKTLATVFKPLTKDVPSYIDWRNKKAVCPVKDQGQCNSSYAFGALAALEGASSLIKKEHAIPFSEQNILDCTVPYGNHGCNGGSVYNVYKYVLSQGGINLAINYRYKGKQGQCFFDDSKSIAGISGMVRIRKGKEKDLKVAVATVGPIAVTVDASSASFRFYSSGVFDVIHCSSTSLNHAMVITGYGKAQNKKYWLVKNSWGKAWGEAGYIRMVRDSYNQCGIASDALYPTL